MDDRERVLARRLLVVVGAGFLVAQLVLFSLDRAPSWDEAIYLSQVTPGSEAIVFAPSRARGITFLVAPATAFGGSMATVRLFLAVASSAALAAAFLPWVPVLGLAAPLAAFTLGFSWLGLFYGSEAMPNLWAAMLGVATAGMLAPGFGGPGRWAVPAAAALLALVGLFRPSDALALAAAFGVAVLLLQGRGSLRTLAWLGGGLAMGWAPWLVEMSVRYGGPVAALREAGTVGHVVPGGLWEKARQYLALTNGPTLGPEQQAEVPVAGGLWVGAVAALAGWALARSRRSAAFGPLVAATLGGLTLAVEYLLVVSGLAPRFLLPAYALLCVPAAAGVAYLLRTRAASPAAATLAIVLVAAWTGWQVGTANRIEAGASVARAAARQVGLAVRDLAGEGPCAFASSDGFPQIAFASGCDGRHLRTVDDDTIEALRALSDRGYRAFVVLRMPPPPGSPLDGLPATTVAAAPGWLVYELPAAPS